MTSLVGSLSCKGSSVFQGNLSGTDLFLTETRITPLCVTSGSSMGFLTGVKKIVVRGCLKVFPELLSNTISLLLRKGFFS